MMLISFLCCQQIENVHLVEIVEKNHLSCVYGACQCVDNDKTVLFF